jgi:hypothetical protein
MSNLEERECRGAVPGTAPREAPTLADARRYQWLRQHKHYALLVGEAGFGYSHAQVEHWSNEQNAAKLDAAVDAARRASYLAPPSEAAKPVATSDDPKKGQR